MKQLHFINLHSVYCQVATASQSWILISQSVSPPLQNQHCCLLTASSSSFAEKLERILNSQFEQGTAYWQAGSTLGALRWRFLWELTRSALRGQPPLPWRWQNHQFEFSTLTLLHNVHEHVLVLVQVLQS